MHVLNKSALRDHLSRWAGALAPAEQPHPFASPAWLTHFVDQAADPAWRYAAPSNGSHAANQLLLFARPEAPHHWSALTNYYASLYSPIVPPRATAAQRAAAVADLVQQIDRWRPRCAVLNLAPLDDSAAETAALQQALQAQGWYVRRYFCFGNWYLPCEGLGFDAYMQARDSQLRNTWARKARKFAAGQGAGAARLQIVTDPSEVAAAIAAYQQVYAKSWKQPEPYPHFVQDWARICAENGWLRLGLAWAGEVPIAAQFWFTMDRRAYIFKLAYDEAHARLSAGTVLSAHMFRHALDVDRVVEIDYLTGDDGYKKSWMTHRRERVGLMACNLRSAAGLRAAVHEYAGALRQRWRARHPAPAPASAAAAADA